MDLETYAANLHQEVLSRCAMPEDGQMQEEAFTEILLEILAEANETTDAEASYYRAKGSRRDPAAKINGYSFAGDAATLDLFVCLYHGQTTVERVTGSEVAEHLKLLRGFLQRSLNGIHQKLEESDAIHEIARRIYEQRETLSSVRLFLLTDGLVDLTRAPDLSEMPIGELEVKHFLWDIAKLHQFQTSGRQREVITLRFRDELDGAVPCLGRPDSTGEYWTYLAFIPGDLLARIYGLHGPRLLEKNVRSFLQVRGKVNKGIQQTLAEAPHRFLAYNNGLSATAREVEIEEAGDGQFHLTSATDFQIVNGGQTTASIYHAWKKEKRDMSQIVVQVKLVVTNDPGRLSDLVPLISLYANSQNRVNTADFSANGPFHQKLESLSRTVWARPIGGMERGTRWYYERARGSYLDDKSRAGTPKQIAQWEQEHPLAQKFTKTDLAKFENTWDEFPHLVSRGAEKNFAEWTQRREESGWPVVDETYFHWLVAKAILFRHTERIISAQACPGYRANIVTYSLAWLVRKSGRHLPLDEIWRSQSLDTTLEKAIDAVGQEARQHITNPPGGMNITEWCKKEPCWHKFRDRDIALPRDWEKALAAESFETRLDTTGTAEMQAAIVAVRTMSAQYWFDVAKWAKKQGYLQPWQRSLAFSLGRLAGQSRPPTGKQAVQGVRIIETVKELGFGRS